MVVMHLLIALHNAAQAHYLIGAIKQRYFVCNAPFRKAFAGGKQFNQIPQRLASPEHCGVVGAKFFHHIKRKQRVVPASIKLIGRDRKSTRLNSSHVANSYAVFCLKKTRSMKSSSIDIL